MSNMGYCRFRNTLIDLMDCEGYIHLPCDDEAEERARLQMINLCRDIGEENGTE